MREKAGKKEKAQSPNEYIIARIVTDNKTIEACMRALKKRFPTITDALEGQYKEYFIRILTMDVQDLDQYRRRYDDLE